jgi:site-specific DNA recombinase
VVIGEPQRAFYGNQFSLTFPVFEHFGVQLWVPEVGGHIDPGSEAHDLAMTLFGNQSKSERMRVKTRVRAAMAAQTAIQGRYLGGRPPYGYRLADAGAHPNPAKARLGARLHKLEPDPATPPVNTRIFALFLPGYGYLGIAELLTGEAIPSPSGYDPDRNPHRDGRAWSKSAVRAILTNPRYTAYQVWNKQRRDEILLDVDDVAAGYTSRMRRNDPDGWIWSEQPAHQPLIPTETYDAAQAQIRSRGWRHKPHRPRELTTARIYLLRRRLRCGLCQRRMEAHWIHKQPYYRCAFPSEYATAKHPDLDHPRTVYLRQAEPLPHLDGWITALFDPANLDHTPGRARRRQRRRQRHRQGTARNRPHPRRLPAQARPLPRRPGRRQRPGHSHRLDQPDDRRAGRRTGQARPTARRQRIEPRGPTGDRDASSAAARSPP